ncbi:hypothetical protein ACFV6E_32685 [Streptomyces sp. NPDC059785]|uniref:hypothetical protein n=1 Tax=Streptomyces sp. NPDC059785 TaxID=3346945 RepID=UPI0036575F00
MPATTGIGLGQIAAFGVDATALGYAITGSVRDSAISTSARVEQPSRSASTQCLKLLHS